AAAVEPLTRVNRLANRDFGPDALQGLSSRALFPAERVSGRRAKSGPGGALTGAYLHVPSRAPRNARTDDQRKRDLEPCRCDRLDSAHRPLRSGGAEMRTSLRRVRTSRLWTQPGYTHGLGRIIAPSSMKDLERATRMR